MTDKKNTTAGAAEPPNEGPAQQHLFPDQPPVEFADAMLPALAQRFPYMFTPNNIGLDMQAGWYPVFEELCNSIDNLLGANKRGFHWRQLKEKFGSARWYWEMDGQADTVVDLQAGGGPVTFQTTPDPMDDLRETIGAEVIKAQAKTTSMCMACGVPASCIVSNGYMVAYCDIHLRLLWSDAAALGRIIQGWEGRNA